MLIFSSIVGLLLVASLVVCILAGINRAPLWVAVLLLVLGNLISLSLGR